MNLTGTSTNPTGGQQNGTATVEVGLGNPPFAYLWSNGQTTQTATGLDFGFATVTVTDAQGCTDVLTINVGNTAAGEVEGLARFDLFPNPTTGLTQLAVELDQPADVQAEIVDLLGRRVWGISNRRTQQLTESFDLTHAAPGLYLLRLTVDGKAVTRKLVRS
jgi:hypothetical protein